MKVIQINSFFSVGGPPRIMNGIYETLLESGHECKIAAAREKILVPADSIPIGTYRDVYLNAFQARILDNDGFAAKKATKDLIKSIDHYNPDIIQLHNLHGYYINIEILFEYLKQCRKPVVWTMHDCWAVTGHCPHFSMIKCERYKEGCFHCPQKREYPSSYLIDQSKRNWDRKKKAFSGLTKMTIITPSKWLSDNIGQSFLSNYPIKVIHNGIDLKRFSFSLGEVRANYELDGKKIVLGVAQNWAENKGFEDFIRLAKLLGNEFKVVMVGLTEDQSKKLPNSILGIRQTDNINELVQWYSNAEVFVNLTYQDTFPTVNIEALACGTPVITYKTGGSPEAIDETCGWVIEQGSVEKVVQTIKTMPNKNHYCNAAIARSKLFDRKIKYQEYINNYTNLIK